jgi:plasmid stability protein
MKNITVSVADEVHRRARIHAAEQGTSVSALVRDYLVSLAAEPGPDPGVDPRRVAQDELFAASIKRDKACLPPIASRAVACTTGLHDRRLFS